MNRSKKSLLFVAGITILLIQTDVSTMDQKAALSIQEQIEFAQMLHEMSPETFKTNVLAYLDRFNRDERYLIDREIEKRKTGLAR